MKDELKEIKHNAEEVTKRLEVRAKAKEDGEHAQFVEKEAKCQAIIQGLQQQLEQAIRTNKEDEAQLRKKKFKVESEVDAWIQKYDQDMEEKQTERDDMAAIYAEEKTQLTSLQQRYEELQAECSRLVESRKRMDDIKRHQEAKALKQAQCATRIQAWWRGYKVRKALKEQNEKKKKGSKSGKKKKK